MIRKILSLILAFLMLLSLLLSCSEKPEKPTVTDAADTTSAAEPETEDKGLVSVDSVPALDFDGEDFTILQYTKKIGSTSRIRTGNSSTISSTNATGRWRNASI